MAKLTLAEHLAAISHGYTSDEYKKKSDRMKRLCRERDNIEDCISVLADSVEPKHIEKLQKKRSRLIKVNNEINKLLHEIC